MPRDYTTGPHCRQETCEHVAIEPRRQPGRSARKQLEARLALLDGLLPGASVFNEDVGYWVDGHQVAHFMTDEVMEVRLTKPRIRDMRPELKADSRVELRRNTSDWVTVHLDRPADVEFIARLVTVAVEAHRPPAGVTAKPPPTGADLERRRRFH